MDSAAAATLITGDKNKLSSKLLIWTELGAAECGVTRRGAGTLSCPGSSSSEPRTQECHRHISGRRFQTGEGPSRGLLRDYEPSDLLRMELFDALVSSVFTQKEF